MAFKDLELGRDKALYAKSEDDFDASGHIPRYEDIAKLDTWSQSTGSPKSHVAQNSEAAANERSACRTRLVRVWLLVIIVMFTICSICNVGITVVAYFTSIPYWTIEPVTSLPEIALVAVPRMIMLLASWFCITTFTWSLLWYKEEPDLHIADFIQGEENYPTVDVFLPRYREEWSLYGPVVQAALALNYPPDKLTVYVCDDGSRVASLQSLIEPLMQRHKNLRYVTRLNGKDAKAGNLNNVLSQSSSQLVTVLDADHCCQQDFLLRTIPHLLASKGGRRVASLSSNIAFVQTTQVFHNERALLVQLLDGSHALFYKLMMASYSGMGCALCVGTGYVMQRAALEDIGNGYITGCAVEDIVTALAMHTRGWTSKYLECRLVVGLSPDTLSEFFLQRERWVAGSAQLLLYKLKPFSNRGLALKQRLAYLVGSWYWVVMLLFLGFIVLRIGLWAACRFITGSSTQTGWPMLTEYVPVYATFLLLPRVGVSAKLANLIAIFSFVPTYLTVAWGALTGTLNPEKHTFQVTASSEAFGDAWPRLATMNLIYVGTVSVVFAGSCIPTLQLYKVALDWLVPTVFLTWSWLVNSPVLYDVGRRGWLLLRR